METLTRSAGLLKQPTNLSFEIAKHVKYLFLCCFQPLKNKNPTSIGKIWVFTTVTLDESYGLPAKSLVAVM